MCVCVIHIFYFGASAVRKRLECLGVTDMLSERLSLYFPYLQRMKLEKEVKSVMLEMDTVSSIVDSIIN